MSLPCLQFRPSEHQTLFALVPRPRTRIPRGEPHGPHPVSVCRRQGRLLVWLARVPALPLEHLLCGPGKLWTCSCRCIHLETWSICSSCSFQACRSNRASMRPRSSCLHGHTSVKKGETRERQAGGKAAMGKGSWSPFYRCPVWVPRGFMAASGNGRTGQKVG